MARKAVIKTQGLLHEAYDADENLRLALIRSSVKTCRPWWPHSNRLPRLGLIDKR